MKCKECRAGERAQNPLKALAVQFKEDRAYSKMGYSPAMKSCESCGKAYERTWIQYVMVFLWSVLWSIPIFFIPIHSAWRFWLAIAVHVLLMHGLGNALVGFLPWKEAKGSNKKGKAKNVLFRLCGIVGIILVFIIGQLLFNTRERLAFARMFDFSLPSGSKIEEVEYSPSASYEYLYLKVELSESEYEKVRPYVLAFFSENSVEADTSYSVSKYMEHGEQIVEGYSTKVTIPRDGCFMNGYAERTASIIFTVDSDGNYYLYADR